MNSTIMVAFHVRIKQILLNVTKLCGLLKTFELQNWAFSQMLWSLIIVSLNWPTVFSSAHLDGSSSDTWSLIADTELLTPINALSVT